MKWGIFMSNFVKSMDNLPRIWKIVLCLPVLDIIWAIWRICKSVERGNILELVLAILWIFAGSTVLWILDIVFIILYNYPFWFK